MRKEAKTSCLRRLNRIEGQVRGLARMVEDDRYCIDIVTQIAAVRAALRRAEEEILQDHVGALRRARDRERQQARAAPQDRRTDGRAQPRRPLTIPRVLTRLRRINIGGLDPAMDARVKPAHDD